VDSSAQSSLGKRVCSAAVSEHERREVALRRIRGQLLERPEDVTLLGRFEVLEHLGTGGFGSVYAAYDPTLDRRVALKLLRTDDEALLREARTLAKLAHPNVVTVHEVVESDCRFALVMELVGGARLDRWVRESSPSVREVLAAFVAAGRGLAAAHARGLVHRDVKPPNILMGDDGQARIADFGLARSAPELGAETSCGGVISTDDGEQSSGTVAAGTPRYWAPELRAGGPATAASDQYAFCLSLTEMLELTPGALPRRVERVLERGLDDDPSQRWPSMDALVGALARRPFRPGWLAVGCAVTIVAAAPWTVDRLSRHHEAQQCRREAQTSSPRWDHESAQRIREAFTRTGLDYAEETWTRVEARLEVYPDAWRRAYEQSCRAARVDDLRSPGTFADAARCFDALGQSFASLVDVLGVVDAEGLRSAVPAAYDLPDVWRCTDAAWLQQQPFPDDETLAASVLQLRAELQREAWARVIRDPDAALESISVLHDRATALDWEPSIAEVSLELGRVRLQRGDLDGAGEAFEAAFRRAGGAGVDTVAADAAIALTDLAGDDRARPEHAFVWSASASMLLDRLDERGRRRAQLATALTGAYRRTGDLERARALADEALALQRAAPDATEIAIAGAIANVAISHIDVGDFDAAAAKLEEALAIKERVLGPNHPSITKTVMNLAGLDLARGAFDDALVRNERALGGARRLGEKHPQVLGILSNMSVIHMRLGNLERARTIAQEVVDGRTDVLGSGHPDTITALNNLAAVSFESGRFAEVEATFEEILRRQRALETIAPLELARTLHNLGAVRVKLDAPARALPSFVEARALFERDLGPEHPEVLRTRQALGVAHMDAGELEAAAAILEPLLELRRRLLDPLDPELAMTIGNLGLLAYHRGDLERALTLLEEAVALHDATGRPSLDAADVLHNLAETHRRLQHRDQAIATYERALVARTEVLGADHVATAATRAALLELQSARAKL
jgi:eukaryotic-like serine/threonine-protein kinase